MKKSALLSILLMTIISNTHAQKWINQMRTPGTSFYKVQKAFKKDMKKHEREFEEEARERQAASLNAPSATPSNEEENEVGGYEQFKRWENFMAPRVFPSGFLPSSQFIYNQMQNAHYSTSRSVSGNWSHQGPTNVPLQSSGRKRGIGRVNCIAFHPSNANIIWVGSPSGGVWKTIDNGTTWSTNSDALSNLGVSDIAVDPINPNNIYVATGDGDAGDTYSYGLMKSTDGGATYVTTGFSFSVSSGNYVRRVLVHPTNPNIVLIGTNIGIYRSTDAGVNFTKVQNGLNTMDMEFKTDDPQIIFASSYSSGGTAKIYKSLNGGTSFTLVSGGLPTTDVSRFAIAVTPANSTTLYAVAANNNGFYKGLYRSVDLGITWTLRSSSPNIIDGTEDASTPNTNSGGQGWYDLTIAVDPADVNNVFVGGVNVWKSTDAGTNWTISSHWTGGQTVSIQYMHADQHAMVFKPGTSVLHEGCDGGYYTSSNLGSTWVDHSDGLHISQFYRLGTSKTNTNKVVAGAQDNGTLFKNGSTWSSIYGGDGMECIIDYNNENTIYGELYNGTIYKSTNSGATYSAIAGQGINGITESGDWVTPYVMHPTANTTLFAGYDAVWKTTNGGSAWTSISQSLTTTAGQIIALAVAKSNTNYIYASTVNRVYRTTTGSGTWTNITGTLPVSSAYITFLAIDPANENRVWVTFSGYSATTKVYYTGDGGTTWASVSTGLPALPINCITYQTGSSDGLYVGTDVGVYYKNSTMSSWQSFNTNMPNVIVRELEINYTNNKIYAATYGRGVWMSDLYSLPTTPPVAEFSGTPTSGAATLNVQFTDLSSSSPTSWSWNFGDGTGLVTIQNPNHAYTAAGTYTVALTATNVNGSNTMTKSNYIVVSAPSAFSSCDSLTNILSNDTLTAYGGGSTGYVSGNNSYADKTKAEFYSSAGQIGNQITGALILFYKNTNGKGTQNTSGTGTVNVQVLTSVSGAPGTVLAQQSVTLASILATTPVNGVNYAGNPGLAFASAIIYPVKVDFASPVNITGDYFINVVLPTTTGDTAAIFQNKTTASHNTNTAWEQWSDDTWYPYSNTASWGSNTSLAILPTVCVTGGITATASATPTTICNGGSTTLNVTASGGTTYTYSWQTGTTSVGTSQSLSVSPTVTTVYTCTVTSGSNTTISNVTVNVTQKPTATAGGSQNICQNGIATVSGASFSNGTILWTENGAGTITTGATTLTPAYTASVGDVGGTVTLTMTVSNAQCTSATSTYSVIVKGTPTASAGGSQTICQTATATVSGATASNGTIAWTENGAGSITSGATTLTPTYTPAAGDAGTSVTLTMIVSNAPCTAATATYTINVTGTPNVFAVANPTSICVGGSSVLTAGGATTYSWNTGQITSSTTVSPTNTITYTVTGTTSGCSKSVSVGVVSTPLPNVTASANPSTICSGGTSSIAGAGATSYTWNSGQNTSSANVSPSTTTTYTVTGTTSGCSKSATTVVTVDNTPSSANAGIDQNICATSSTLAANSPSIGTGSWTKISGTGTVTNPSIFNSTVTGLTLGAASSFRWTVSSGSCINSTDDVVIISYATPSTPVATLNADTVCSNIASGNQWYNTSGIIIGATQQCYVTPTAGSYYDIVTLNGCSSAQSNVVVITGLKSQISNLKSQISIYPNPSNGKVIVEGLIEGKTAKIEVYNEAGKKVYEATGYSINGKLRNELNLENMSSGNYEVRIITIDKTINQRLVIVK